MQVCGDHYFPFFRCLHFYHCLLGGTVGCHCDCIRSCYSCVILAEFQAETEGYARPYGWHRNECFNMQLTSAGSPFLFQSLNKGAPPTPPLPLLFLPKALTTSSSNQIPATVQWRGPISDNAIAACLSGCTYVRTLVRETIQSCIKFFSLYLSCYLWLYSIMYFKLDNVTTIMQKKL